MSVSDSPDKRPRGEGRPQSKNQATNTPAIESHPTPSSTSLDTSQPTTQPYSQPVGSHPPPPALSLSSPGAGSSRKPNRRKTGPSAQTAQSRSGVLKLQKQDGARPLGPQGDGPSDDGIWVGQLERDRMGFSRRYQLIVRQDPERARLCSFKEENVTTDRRPIDPPPIIEIQTSESDPAEFLECTSLFLRATLVAATPNARPSSPSSQQRWDAKGHSQWPGDGHGGSLSAHAGRSLDQFATVNTPTGGEATAGEVVLTPEKLKDMNGAFSSFCVFSKLSVRVPGVFRLKMTLYETIGSQVDKMASVLTDQFEVYSPKRFTGMKESTALTRHFAHQGLKIKLRAGSTVASIGKTKKKAATPTTIRRPESPVERAAGGTYDSEGRASSLHRGRSIMSTPTERGRRPSVPSGLSGPSVPFPDLPPYAGPSTSARVQLPSIGDLTAFSLRPSYQSAAAMPPPHYPGRPPHALTRWQAPLPHLLGPTPTGSLAPPVTSHPAYEDQLMPDATSPREIPYSSPHPYPSPYSQPHPNGSAFGGPHSLPEYGGYHPGPDHGHWREREWSLGGGARPPVHVGERDRPEPHSDARTPHLRSDAGSSSSDGFRLSQHRHLRSPSSGSGAGSEGGQLSGSGREDYQSRIDYSRYGPRKPHPFATHPSADYSARPQGYYGGSDRDRSAQHEHVPTEYQRGAPLPRPHANHHHAAYSPSYDHHPVPRTFSPLGNSSSTPSSGSTVVSNPTGDSSSSRAVYAPHHMPSPFGPWSFPPAAQRPMTEHHHSHPPGSGASMATRPKKIHSSIRGGLDAHGYSHRPDLMGTPWTGDPNHPYPYPSLPQHQYFPRGGGDLGSTGRRRSGSPDWKEPLAQHSGLSKVDARGPDGRTRAEAEVSGRSE